MAKKDVTMNVELQKWVEETKDENGDYLGGGY